ncbi:MAG: 3'(2'),5'-bisphosphate nucleotidase CysQ [Gelidibacter sp.]
MNENLKIAILASLEAGNAIMKVYDAPIEVELKEDKSPLTEADRQANSIINSHLRTTEIPIISEENKQTDYSIRKEWDTCWIVDPVDGTKEFIKRNGEFTVNIALVIHQKPQLGVIYVPYSKELYFADVQTKTAFKANLKSHNTTIEKILDIAQPLQHESSHKKVIRVVASRSHMNAETLNFMESLNLEGHTTETVSKGSSLKFCLLAEGKADVYPRHAPTMEWDTAAGQAICNALGIEVISKDTDKPLLYNKESLLNPWFLVSAL